MVLCFSPPPRNSRVKHRQLPIRQLIGMYKEMSDNVQELLMLYKNGTIDGEALTTALKELNNAPPQEPQPREKLSPTE